MQSIPEMIVIGGGLAGLTAAAHLAERGVKPLVLEANQSWLGGRLAGGEDETFQYIGQRWSFPTEHGIHGLWGGYVNMRATLERFVNDPALSPVASGGEVWVNRWGEKVWKVEAGTVVRSWILPAPFHYLNLLLHPRFWGAITPLDFLSAPGIIFSTLWTVGYDPIKEESALDGFTMDDYFRLWTPNLRATFEGVVRNMLAAPDEAITLTGMIAALRFYTMLRRDDWHPYFFPVNIRAALIDPLEQAIRTRGGVVLRGLTARQLIRHGNGWRVIAETSGGHRRTFDAANVIIALPSGAASKLLKSSEDTRSQAETLRFPGMLRNTVVRLWFSDEPGGHETSGMFTGDFIPDNYFWLHRIHREYKQWAGQGGSAIELHFYGNNTLLNQPDRNFIILAVEEVQRAFPRLKGTFVHGAVRRNSATHTSFRVMTEDTLGVNTPWVNLYACGDWVRYDTPSLWMERACTTGIAAANAVLSNRSLPEYEVRYPRQPEPGVRLLSLGVRAVRGSLRPIISMLRGWRQTL